MNHFRQRTRSRHSSARDLLGPVFLLGVGLGAVGMMAYDSAARPLAAFAPPLPTSGAEAPPATAAPTRNAPSHPGANAATPSARLRAERRGVTETPVERGAFRNCAAARAAGAAPVYRGEPGYGAHLDGDNDGIGCEPYRP